MAETDAAGKSMPKEALRLRSLACSLPPVKLAAEVRSGMLGQIFGAFSDNPGFGEDGKLCAVVTRHTIRIIKLSGRTTRVLVERRGSASSMPGRE